jgi:hypothetical protein
MNTVEPLAELHEGLGRSASARPGHQLLFHERAELVYDGAGVCLIVMIINRIGTEGADCSHRGNT